MSGRRASGRNAGRVSYAEPVADLDEEDVDAEFDEETKAKKRKIVQKELAQERNKRRRSEKEDPEFKKGKKQQGSKGRYVKRFKDAGKLSSFFQLPMDLLATVFEKLEPVDLLHLSRTNKQLNEWFSSPDSASVWAACRRNLVLYIPKNASSFYHYYGDSEGEEVEEPEYDALHMPERPANLSERAYARLLFDKSCYDCLATNKRNFFESYQLQARFCKKCRSDNIVLRSEAPKLLQAQVEAGETIDDDVYEIVPKDDADQFVVGDNSPDHPTQSTDLRELQRQCLLDAHKVYLSRKKELPEEEFAIWVKARKEAVQSASVSVDVVRSWVSTFASYGRDEFRRAYREKQVRQIRRKNAFRSRVAAEPWYDERSCNSYMSSAHARKLFTKKQDFDTAEWESLRETIESEFAARKAFFKEFEDYDKMSRARLYINKHYREDFKAPSDLPDYGLASGWLLALPVMTDLLKEIDSSFQRSDDLHASAGWELDELHKHELNILKERHVLWTSRHEEVNEQSEQKQIDILSDLSQKLIPHFPDHPDPSQTLDRVTAEKGDEVTAIDHIRALTRDLSGVHAVFACSHCESEQNRYYYAYGAVNIIRLPSIKSHTHFATTVQRRDYNAQQGRRSYLDENVAADWDADKVTVPADLVFATKLLTQVCAKGKVRKWEQKAWADDESKAFSFPESVAAFDTDFAFACLCNMNKAAPGSYVEAPFTRRWDEMVRHLQQHYANAQDLVETPITASSIHIVVKPVAPPAPALTFNNPSLWWDPDDPLESMGGYGTPSDYGGMGMYDSDGY